MSESQASQDETDELDDMLTGIDQSTLAIHNVNQHEECSPLILKTGSPKHNSSRPKFE
jgi:hypothetical protein